MSEILTITDYSTEEPQHVVFDPLILPVFTFRRDNSGRSHKYSPVYGRGSLTPLGQAARQITAGGVVVDGAGKNKIDRIGGSDIGLSEGYTRLMKLQEWDAHLVEITLNRVDAASPSGVHPETLGIWHIDNVSVDSSSMKNSRLIRHQWTLQISQFSDDPDALPGGGSGATGSTDGPTLNPPGQGSGLPGDNTGAV